MEYKIIKAWSHDYLENRVDYMLSKGWILQGGVSVTAIEHGVQYAQAMIKRCEIKRDVQEPIAQSIRDLSEFLNKHI